MRPRHAARFQRPHGQTPEAIRPEPHGHMAENPRTRSHTDTLAYTHARAPRCEGPRGPTAKSRSECEPGGFHIQEVRTPLIDNHALSGWLFDRGSGLRTRPWYQDAAPRTSPALSIYNGGLSESICEQHRFPMRVLGSDPTFLGLYARPDVGRANYQRF